MGLVLLAVIWLITLISSYFFVAKSWFPHGASAAAPWIDHQFTLTLVLMGIVFIGSLFVVVMTIVADVVYAIADPRIRY